MRSWPDGRRRAATHVAAGGGHVTRLSLATISQSVMAGAGAAGGGDTSDGGAGPSPSPAAGVSPLGSRHRRRTEHALNALDRQISKVSKTKTTEGQHDGPSSPPGKDGQHGGGGVRAAPLGTAGHAAAGAAPADHTMNWCPAHLEPPKATSMLDVALGGVCLCVYLGAQAYCRQVTWADCALLHWEAFQRMPGQLLQWCVGRTDRQLVLPTAIEVLNVGFGFCVGVTLHSLTRKLLVWLVYASRHTGTTLDDWIFGMLLLLFPQSELNGVSLSSNAHVPAPQIDPDSPVRHSAERRSIPLFLRFELLGEGVAHTLNGVEALVCVRHRLHTTRRDVLPDLLGHRRRVLLCCQTALL